MAASSPDCILVALVLACSARGGSGFMGATTGTKQEASSLLTMTSLILL